MEKPLVVVQDLGQIRAADPRIRGVLGENFLAHFDLLIDYPHKLLCLDEGRVVQGAFRGERIPLVTARHAEDELPFTDRLVIAVSLSDTGGLPILLQLDAGSDGPILYAGNRKLEQPFLKHETLQRDNVSKAQQAFALLPPQNMQIGTRTLRKCPVRDPGEHRGESSEA